MEHVPMNDGLDGRETIAFGLAAGEVAAFVVALMTAYAVVHSGVAPVVAWLLAGLLAGGGAVLAWGRLAGRPMLEWALLLARFLIRSAPARTARARARVDAWSAELRTYVSEKTARVRPRAAAEGGAVVIPLALRRPDPMASPRGEPRRGRSSTGSHVVGFVSLAGGSGRTTLAVEVAAILAVRGRAAAAMGPAGARVALLDLTRRNPAVGLRLGLVPPPADASALVAHPTGLLVAVAAPSATPAGAPPPLRASLVDGSHADVVVVDFDCDLGDHCRELLARCDQLLVTVTPTAGGVADAYRSTALLRRLGLGERVGLVVNRWRPGLDLAEVMSDLGGEILAEVPDDDALVDAENSHRLAGVDGDGAVGSALHRLATCIETRSGAARAAPAALCWGSHAG